MTQVMMTEQNLYLAFGLIPKANEPIGDLREVIINIPKNYVFNTVHMSTSISMATMRDVDVTSEDM